MYHHHSSFNFRQKTVNPVAHLTVTADEMKFWKLSNFSACAATGFLADGMP